VNIILESWRFLQANNRLTLYGYVILENHLHLIAAAEDLSEEIQCFKSYTARRIIDHLKERHVATLLRGLQMLKPDWKGDSEYQLWEEGSHPQEIDHDAMMEQKLDYMHLNPVERGYVDEPVHWRYSSARNYAGMAGLIPVTTDWR
jgi:REP element-mobilizing transposase RayT